MTVQKWEYLVVSIGLILAADVLLSPVAGGEREKTLSSALLNKLGAEGWEAVALATHTGPQYLLMKRPMP